METVFVGIKHDLIYSQRGNDKPPGEKLET